MSHHRSHRSHRCQKEEKCDKHCKGPVECPGKKGKRGCRGRDGPTGPTGPSESTNFFIANLNSAVIYDGPQIIKYDSFGHTGSFSYDETTGKITIPDTGYYQITSLTNFTAFPGLVKTCISQNLTPIAPSYINVSNTEDSSTFASLTTVIGVYLYANDFITINFVPVVNNSGLILGADSNHNTNVTIIRLD